MKRQTKTYLKFISKVLAEPTNKSTVFKCKTICRIVSEAGRNVGRESSVITRLNRYSNNTDWQNGVIDTDWQDYIFKKEQ